jgi:tetratricopeptide (TPR) repeat protein
MLAVPLRLASFRRLSPLSLAAASLIPAAILVSLLSGPTVLAADRPRYDRKARKDMEFASEMAEKGLWREALFRWTRVAERFPEDPRVMNNIAVAHEALGNRKQARRAYTRALELASISEISANQALFSKAGNLGEDESSGGGGT